MKTVACIISAFCLYSVTLAQGTSFEHSYYYFPDSPHRFEVKQEQNYQRGDLKGPRAKNHPDWKYKSSLTVVKHATSPKNRIGPAAKNYHPGRNNQPAQYQMVTKKDKENLKGPRAKNRKPWRN